MKKRFGALLLLLLVLSTLTFFSCKGYDQKQARKERIAFWVDTISTKDIQSVAAQLEAWHFPLFHSNKLLLIEQKFETAYYKDLPDKETLAKETARIYLETYYDQTDIQSEEENTYAIITSYITAVGDKYGVYRSPVEYEDYHEYLSGEYVGIGVSVQNDPENKIIKITGVTPDGPAEEAGLLPGDIIYAVNDQLASDLGYDGVLSAARGEVGETVNITVLRDAKTLTFSIVRRALADKTVHYALDEESGIAYVRITQFKSTTAEQFFAVIDELEANPSTKAYIFDVRNNTGGYLYTVVDVLSYLTRAGATIVTFSEKYSEPMYDTDDHAVEKPMIVLTNYYTVSAAELFTASLRENKDCEIVGEKTYGKGVMQNTFRLSDGSSITLTISEYNSPSGINYDGIGIAPDHEVKNTEESDMQLAFATERLLEKINK